MARNNVKCKRDAFTSEPAPVTMLQALQGSIQALEAQTAHVLNNEKTATIAEACGGL